MPTTHLHHEMNEIEELIPERYGWTAAVLTVSDRSYRGERRDDSGPVLMQLLCEEGYVGVACGLMPDEQDAIEAALKDFVEAGHALILTTGGTGFAPRDCTPEATKAICTKDVPGIPELMRLRSLEITERACLSRAYAGIAGLSLIVNLPGSPKAARENYEAVAAPLLHGIKMLREGQANCAALEAHEL